MDNRSEGRPFLAILLSILVFVAWSYFFGPKQAPKPPTPSTSTAEAIKEQPKAPESVLPQEQSFAIESPAFQAEISSYNGIIRSWKIKDDQYADNGTPLELIPILPEKRRGGMAEITIEKASFAIPGTMVFEKVINPGDPSGSLRLRWQDAEKKISLDKYFRVDDDGNGLLLELVWNNNSQNNQTVKYTMSMESYQDPAKSKGSGFFIFQAPPDVATPSCYANEKLVSVPYKEQTQHTESAVGEVAWAGISRTFFLKAMYPRTSETGSSCSVTLESNSIEHVQLTFAEDRLSVGRPMSRVIGLYAGPKKTEQLAAKSAKLEESVAYGWLGFLARPMHWMLKLFYSVTYNWGIAIILLTLVVRLVMLLPAQSSMKSMQAMASLKPEIDALREKHGNDQMAFMQAQGDLFKKHGISPFGGCLPLLLQMPFFFAIYSMIHQAVELYHADFALWITDLSAPDPYHVLPLCIGLVIFLQQKLTPTQMDSSQARIMLWLMPLMMVGFMFFLPSGLVLYTFTSTIFGVVQQIVVRRSFEASKNKAEILKS